MLGSYRLPFVVGAAASLGGGAYVGLLLPSTAAVQQRMVQETQEGKLAKAATSAPAAVASNASTAASSSSSNGGAGVDGGAGEGSSSGLVVGALPRLLLLCFYLFCTCISQGFLLVAQ